MIPDIIDDDDDQSIKVLFPRKMQNTVRGCVHSYLSCWNSQMHTISFLSPLLFFTKSKESIYTYIYHFHQHHQAIIQSQITTIITVHLLPLFTPTCSAAPFVAASFPTTACVAPPAAAPVAVQLAPVSHEKPVGQHPCPLPPPPAVAQLNHPPGHFPSPAPPPPPCCCCALSLLLLLFLLLSPAGAAVDDGVVVVAVSTTPFPITTPLEDRTVVMEMSGQVVLEQSRPMRQHALGGARAVQA